MTLWKIIVTEKLVDWAPINAATKENIPHVDSYCILAQEVVVAHQYCSSTIPLIRSIRNKVLRAELFTREHFHS